ncbi:MAG: hypothetical protein ABIJ28_01140 [Patescibacteria group bacterium]
MEPQQTIPINDPQTNNAQKSEEEFPDISPKSTKPELMKAYKALVKKYEENIQTKKTDQSKKAAEKQLVEKAEQYTVDNIVQNLNGLKSNMIQGTDDLAGKLIREANKMGEIQKAIKIEENKLQELYDIKIAAESLEELIKTQQKQKEDFNLEYEKIKQGQQREQEEYDYNLKQERKKEQGIYEEKQEEFKKREQELISREQELIDLRQKVEEFPVKLEQAVKEAKEKTAHYIKKEMQIQADLLAKGVEGDKKVMETKLQYFEDMIAKQNEQIESSKQKLDSANKQVQTIAEKALESSSGKQTLRAVSDIAMQQAGKTGTEED